MNSAINLKRVYAVLLRNFFADKRSVMRITEVFYYPAIDIVLWGLTTKWLSSGNTTKTIVALATSLVLWQITSRCIYDISVGMVEELWHRSITNFFGSPLKLSEWMLANMLTGVCKLFVVLPYCAFLVWIAYGVNIFSLGFSLTLYVLLLLCCGWTIGFLGASIILYWGRQAQSTPWMIAWLFVPLCAVYYPLESLPRPLQFIASCTPLAQTFEALRFQLFTNTVHTQKIILAAILAVIYLSLSMMLFRSMFKKALNRGLSSLE